MGEHGRNGEDVFEGVGGAVTMEIVRYLGHRIMTQTEALADGYRATAWVVRIDVPGAPVRSAGSAVARTEAQAVRDAQIHARLAIEIALEDEALRNDSR